MDSEPKEKYQFKDYPRLSCSGVRPVDLQINSFGTPAFKRLIAV